MKTLDTYEDAWAYAHRVGFCAKAGYPGWIPAAQGDMVTISHLIERMSGNVYPCQVETRMHISESGHRFPWLSTMYVAGAIGHTQCNIGSWRSPTPENADKAPIIFYTLRTHAQGVKEDVAGNFWLHEAQVKLRQKINDIRREHKGSHFRLDPGGMYGNITLPDYTTIEVDIMWHDLEGVTR